jgi:competence CoiA-like predicted nuclease
MSETHQARSSSQTSCAKTDLLGNMKYALINGKKSEATKGTKGLCPSCGSELIAKCGEIKVNHWAHKGRRHCDHWWEPETEWHRSWKDKFPNDWQEVHHKAEDGEIHIADVKTEDGWIIEFQHSFLNPEERLKRNAFYRKIVWVVDGLRRKTDKLQFQKMIEEESILVSQEPLIRQVYFPEECRLMKEWHDGNAFVFFDFQ